MTTSMPRSSPSTAGTLTDLLSAGEVSDGSRPRAALHPPSSDASNPRSVVRSRWPLDQRYPDSLPAQGVCHDDRFHLTAGAVVKQPGQSDNITVDDSHPRIHSSRDLEVLVEPRVRMSPPVLGSPWSCRWWSVNSAHRSRQAW